MDRCNTDQAASTSGASDNDMSSLSEQMESFRIHQLPLPTCGEESYVDVLESMYIGAKGYEVKDDEENCILRTREIFTAAVEKHRAPAPVPTVFRNNSERSNFVQLDHKKRKLEPKNPPAEMMVLFTFADDIFANIVIKFSKDYPEGKQKPYLLHDKPARIICLSQEYSAEEAFEEALSLNPMYYSDEIEVVKKSPYVDPDHSNWRLQEGCMAEYSRVEDNEIQFVVDVSVIYPENTWSTAFIVCYDCGKVAEIALCDAVKEAARKEIWHNITQYNIGKNSSERERSIIRLPITNSLHSMCSFREGLIGFTPLTLTRSSNPALFVRIRLTFYTNEDSRFGHVLHNRKWT